MLNCATGPLLNCATGSIGNCPAVAPASLDDPEQRITRNVGVDFNGLDEFLPPHFIAKFIPLMVDGTPDMIKDC